KQLNNSERKTPRTKAQARQAAQEFDFDSVAITTKQYNAALEARRDSIWKRSLSGSVARDYAIDDIVVPPRMRQLDEKKVAEIIDSVGTIGKLIHPIVLQWELNAHGLPNGRLALCAGFHRLEAFRRMGRTRIPAIVEEYDSRIFGQLIE